MDITIDEVKDSEYETLANLVKMYCYEWSQYNLFDVDENGVYPFEQYLHLYFERSRRYSYLVRVNGFIAGFALIDDDFVIHNDYDYSMGEFFVMHKYRRLKVGRYMANFLFDKHKGMWEVGFHPKNTTSENFWLSVISDYTNKNYTLNKECSKLTYNDGSRGSVISFDSRITPVN